MELEQVIAEKELIRIPLPDGGWAIYRIFKRRKADGGLIEAWVEPVVDDVPKTE